MTSVRQFAPATENPSNRHILTIAVEDYFQGKAFNDLIDRRQWSRFETRVERNTIAALDLLDRHQVRATFFFKTWIAEHHAGLVHEVVRRGHEIASSGEASFRSTSRSDFARSIQKSRDILEAASGTKVRGFRVADHRLKAQDLWAFEVLAAHGYQYDSSLHPSLLSFRREPWRRFVHKMSFEGSPFWEVPLSSLSLGGLDLPVAGGNWFRQLPESLIRGAVQYWSKHYTQPFVMYFRVWDLDPDQPVITAASRLSRFRHYRNPDKSARLLESFLASYRFTGIADYLGLETAAAPIPQSAPVRESYEIRSAPELGRTRQEVTVVIPCYNEKSALPYLANTLAELRKSLQSYSLQYVFVDDGSQDGTPETLHQLFGAQEGCTIVEHIQNQGVAAAILSGIHHATTEIVCSMDCDCTYDPYELANMIPLLTPGVDLVTASPYHPAGHVLHVPGWRLGLSKTASWLYRMVLRQPLYTYTSCFRVYRRSAVLPIRLREGGFLGVAEMIAVLDLNGGRIVEHPATLQVRMLGHSKMRVLQTIGGHIRMMSRFARERWLKRAAPQTARPPEFPATVYASKGVDRE